LAGGGEGNHVNPRTLIQDVGVEIRTRNKSANHYTKMFGKQLLNMYK